MFLRGAVEDTDRRYKDFEIQLNRGDKQFLYTDRLPEATDSEGCMYLIDMQGIGRKCSLFFTNSAISKIIETTTFCHMKGDETRHEQLFF